MYTVVPEATGQQERAGQGGRMSAAVRDNNVRDNNVRDNNVRDNNVRDNNVRDNNVRDNNVRDNNVLSQSATSGIDHAASHFTGHPADLLATTAATIVARALPRDCARRPAP
jgi:hypothetical protein